LLHAAPAQQATHDRERRPAGAGKGRGVRGAQRHTRHFPRTHSYEPLTASRAAAPARRAAAAAADASTARTCCGVQGLLTLGIAEAALAAQWQHAFGVGVFTRPQAQRVRGK
jgi:hypothetical protein